MTADGKTGEEVGRRAQGFDLLIPTARVARLRLFNQTPMPWMVKSRDVVYDVVV